MPQPMFSFGTKSFISEARLESSLIRQGAVKVVFIRKGAIVSAVRVEWDNGESVTYDVKAGVVNDLEHDWTKTGIGKLVHLS